MKLTLFMIISLLLLASCGGDDTESYLENLLGTIYTGKRTTAFLNRMHPILAKEVRMKSLEIFNAKDNLPEKVSSHSLSSVKMERRGDRKFFYGFIKESMKDGSRNIRTFLAKYILQRPPGADKKQSDNGIWILYDLIVKKGKMKEAARALIDISEPGDKASKLLASLPEPLNIMIFDTSPETLSTHFLKAVAVQSGGKISLEFLNPYLERGSATTYKITDPGYIVLTRGKQVFKISRTTLLVSRGETGLFQGERVILGAIRRILGHNSNLVYLTGHGEKSTKDDNEANWSKAFEELSGCGFLLTTAPSIDKTVIGTNKVLCMAAPTSAPSAQELDLLKKHLTGGGAAVFFLEKPVPYTLAAQMNLWGIEFLSHTIVDPANKDFIKGSTWFECHVPDTELTEFFASREDFKVLVGGAVGMRLGKKTAGGIHSFLTTTTNGWAEASFEEDKPDDLEFSPGLDIRGPIALAYSLSGVEKKGRVVVFGDSDFVSDKLFTSKISNWIFFINGLNWLTDREAAALPVRTFPWKLMQSML